MVRDASGTPNTGWVVHAAVIAIPKATSVENLKIFERTVGFHGIDEWIFVFHFHSGIGRDFSLAAQFAPQGNQAERSETEQGKCRPRIGHLTLWGSNKSAPRRFADSSCHRQTSGLRCRCGRHSSYHSGPGRSQRWKARLCSHPVCSFRTG